MAIIKTGEICKISGIYKCDKHNHQDTFVEGKKIPPCSKDGGHSASWTLIQAAKH